MNYSIPNQWHWREYFAEFLGAAFNIFIGLSAIVFNFGHGLPIEQLVPDSSIRRLITGLIFAGSGAIVAVSPIGKLSGSHINPSVSLAFWIHGKMHLRDFVGFVIGQFLGAIAVGAFRLFTLGERDVLTGKLYHAFNYPSIFKNVKLPHFQHHPHSNR
ncbi:MAG: aquaporin [Nostoc sp. JL31]|uniref:aquaporin n=1 Tax=Nostoc sp. JL31 TaxID=2815395 RepID=UPI0025EA5170|nr:aquaporin [Nostoc sp. JL31]MBN3889354.1 aquaporin [Nostoc sp. JL31]